MAARSKNYAAGDGAELPGFIPTNESSGGGPTKSVMVNRSNTLNEGALLERKMASGRTVMVVVRARPFNSREKEMKAKTCLTVQDSTVRIVDGEQKQPREFTYDLVFPQSVGQEHIFDTIGVPMLNRVVQGFNACIFAYGQTGSGKTYTMLGAGDSKSGEGIIPRLCNQLLEVVSADQDFMYSIKASYMEIYKEKLRDLLLDGSDADADLQIREDKKGLKGIYVEGISMKEITSYGDLEELVNKGTASRVVGSTNMNATSSRSHAVLTLYVESQDVDDTQGFTTKVSKLHLVDLAGSERAKATGATGARLKEGAEINKSLSALGNVVNALTSKGSHVPYRDSKLTRFLQDSLGGNSYTMLVANLSPADVNSAETLSTLRFAERAKKIKNVSIVNRDPAAAKIAELMALVKQLRARIMELEGVTGDIGNARLPSNLSFVQNYQNGDMQNVNPCCVVKCGPCGPCTSEKCTIL